MKHVSILFSKKDRGLYIGFTSDIKQRLKQHNQGLVTSTKNRRPFDLIHLESFVVKEDAKAREEYLKSGYGRQQLRSQLKRLFQKLNL